MASRTMATNKQTTKSMIPFTTTLSPISNPGVFTVIRSNIPILQNEIQ